MCSRYSYDQPWSNVNNEIFAVEASSFLKKKQIFLTCIISSLKNNQMEEKSDFLDILFHSFNHAKIKTQHRK